MALGDMTLGLTVAVNDATKAVSEINKVKQSVSSVGEEVSKAEKKSVPAWKQMRSSVNNFLGPLTTARFLILRASAGMAAVATPLIAMNKLLLDAASSYKELDAIAAQANSTFEEVSMLRFGEVFDDRAVRAYTSAISRLGDELEKAKLKAANFIATMLLDPTRAGKAMSGGILKLGGGLLKTMFPQMGSAIDLIMKQAKNGIDGTIDSVRNLGTITVVASGQINTMGKEQLAVYLKLKDNIRSLSMMTADYQLYNLNQARKRYEKELQLDQNLSEEQRKIRTNAINEWYTLNANFINRSRWGFQTWAKEIGGVMQKFGQETSKVFSDLLIDGLDNKFQNARQIAYSFVKDLRDMLIKAAMNQLIASIFSGFGGGATAVAGGGGGGIFGSIGGLFSKIIPHAEGGVVTKPHVGLVGEAGPEAIIPLDKTNGLGGDTYIYINAVDSASFNDMIRRNPDSIISVVQDSKSKNKSMRQALRGR